MKAKRDKILVFGNVIVKGDNIPLRIMPRLQKRFPNIEFKEFDPNENLESEGRSLNIIDAVEGIEKAVVITDIARIKTQKLFSMHDFDLGYSLKLLKKLGYLESVRIFGVPMKISDDAAFEQLSELITSSLP